MGSHSRGRGLALPSRLRAGDRVVVVAPAGPVPREPFEAGVRRLAERYQVIFDEALFTRLGFLAGDDDRRVAELQAALADETAGAIVCARGGYGLTRILGRLDLAPLRRRPRPVVGFSDVTALHAACLGAGVVSLHGPVVTQLARLETPVEELFERLESAEPAPPWRGLRPVAAGVAEGVAVGGNLEVFSRLVGTPWMPDLDGAVLFIEEVGERPYRIDRALTHLGAAGALDRLAAVVVGDLTHCREPDGTSEADAVIDERLGRLGVPVVAGGPFGHGERNRAFAHGGLVRVDGGSGVVEFLEGAVG